MGDTTIHRVNLDNAFHLLAENLRERSELEFIENLTQLLSELLGADHVMVSEIFEADVNRAHVVSFYSRGSHRQVNSYDLHGSPCETVISSGFCVYSEAVCKTFPDDELLQQLSAESYIGVPMLAVDGHKLGILAVLNDAPTDYSNEVFELLQVAASQAAAEMAQVRITNRLKESERRLQTLMDSLPGMAYRCKNDKFWTMEMVSRGARKLTGYDVTELQNNATIPYIDIIHPEDKMKVAAAVKLAVENDDYFKINYRIIRADGVLRWVWEQGKGVRSKSGEMAHLEGFILDVTEQYLQQERITEIAFTDELTGLPNRPGLLDFLEREYEREQGPDYLLVLVDICGFRNINERFSLHAGDRLLSIVAARLQEGIRKLDDTVLLARLTGDEFVVVSTEQRAGIDEFLQLADALTQLFIDPVSLGEHQLTLQVKLSGAWSSAAISGAELLQQASIAMYEAKQNGLRYCTFDTDLERKVSSERRRTERFLMALENHELSIYLQPQIELRSGRCVGAEVLCRWFDNELGTVPPDIFIDIARKQGVLAELGYQVFEKTCGLINEWRHRYQSVPPIAVNVGAQQFASEDVVEDFVRICGQLPPQAVTLEITESDLMIDPKQALVVTKRLREMGFRLAIDDFGTGYSSLAYLQQFDVDILKIDMSFVQAMTLDEQSKTLVNTILVMAKTLGLATIAEGIETAEQAMMLKQLGCELGQGFYYARPMSPEEFEKQWLQH
ncbi:bifunctional diguanylate cyclase/phosphodiesterase [Pseudidiomarina sp. E22-M8]|uniref:bifunctional diguanylate cyclase/phosphodiesterase n=1 Tax=Pseudidiomarina sp. E22-M8 TaxID=3424768 RepID=UPI00403D1A91